jgi:hypothetical protein
MKLTIDGRQEVVKWKEGGCGSNWMQTVDVVQCNVETWAKFEREEKAERRQSGGFKVLNTMCEAT